MGQGWDRHMMGLRVVAAEQLLNARFCSFQSSITSTFSSETNANTVQRSHLR